MTAEAGPEISSARVRFKVSDPDHRFSTVRLYQEIKRPRQGPEFVFDDGTWVCDFPRPDADRMEYLIEVEHADGGWETLRDGNNDKLSPGAFGDKSVIEFPGYSAPEWVDFDGDEGDFTEISLACRAIRDDLPALLWSPPETDPDEPLPLLVVHDGPEFARLAGLTRFLAHGASTDSLPKVRAALLQPKDRDQIYSASAAYARSLSHEIVPRLLDELPVPGGRNNRMGIGSSLGALAMLHCHRRSPATFGSLYLQSGSYFRLRFDKQESGFARFNRISRFVGEILSTEEWAHPIPINLTCGTIEENLANNSAVALALSKQGYDVKIYVNRDGHNWVGWRDTFDPYLADLMNRMWG